MLATSRHYLGATGGLTAIKVVSLYDFALAVKAVWAVSHAYTAHEFFRALENLIATFHSGLMLASGKHGSSFWV